MPSNFIFADTIQKLIRKGEQKLTLSKKARISHAAVDLIEENRIRLIYEEDMEPASHTTVAKKTIETDINPETETNPPAETVLDTDSGTGQTDLPVAVSNADETSEGVETDVKAEIEEHIELLSKDITEAQVEEITRRVIERLNEVKTCTDHEAAIKEESDPDDDLVICRCEEVTRKEIKDVIRNGMATLNGIKRVTRAGMGLCQGQTCQTLVTRIIAQETGVPPAQLEPTTARAPVRPVRLSTFAELN